MSSCHYHHSHRHHSMIIIIVVLILFYSLQSQPLTHEIVSSKVNSENAGYEHSLHESTQMDEPGLPLNKPIMSPVYN